MTALAIRSILTRLWCVTGLLLVGALSWSSAGAQPNCGRENGRPCTVFERIPSCDAGLIEQAGRCIRPSPCGYAGERACTIAERVPSCNDGLVEINGRCARPSPCGGQDMRACTVAERLPSCNHGLIEVAGRCVVPSPCGSEGLRACLVRERVPSCDPLLVERAGRCVRLACGQVDARPCVVTERIPACDTQLIERNGRCVLSYTPQAGPAASAGSGRVAPAFGSRPAATRPPASQPASGGCRQQAFPVREACTGQHPQLWLPKTLYGCTYEDAVQKLPPAPRCWYVR